MSLEYKARLLADLKIKHGNDLQGKSVRASKKKIESNIKFRKNLLESQLGVGYVNEFARLFIFDNFQGMVFDVTAPFQVAPKFKL